MSRTLHLVLLGTLLLLHPEAARAGMPSLTLTDVAKLRVENLSFFLVGFFLAALGIQWVWNGLRRDFTVLPRLSYLRALGLVFLWGTLFVLVLTMISGARELLTPGAWEKQGLTYRLKQEPAPTPTPASDHEQHAERQRHLEQLRVALWDYAAKHDGQFPPTLSEPYLASDKCHLPHLPGLRYLYISGQRVGGPARLLVFEPEVPGSPRYVLLTNGLIRTRSSTEILAARTETLP